jgi:hypothetical protein
MTVIEEIGTGVVYGLAAIAVLSFVAIAAATILVTCAVRLEERYSTLSGPPPTWFCALARRLMAVPDLSLRAGRAASRPVTAAVAELEPDAAGWPTIANEWPAIAADRLPVR